MSRQSKELKSREVAVAPDFTKGYQYEDVSCWRPTLKDRLQILVGFNVIIRCKMITQHKPGTVATGIFPQTTEHESKTLQKMPWLLKILPTKPLPQQETKTAEELKALPNEQG